ncbi:Putative sulfur deprivation response regulator [Saliniradius amylolyticus]|uniref:Sulfur deprivation response regulator n=1 Tax=Saliniradius amylolyticus TaxID=2183582 RepID=A0A2S2E5A4_9ALTE|nr:SLC13 family permease [Saliniradius amylolyticus]AWL12410.1 Putative sulfur deprivation response regulator [Saliniradius amylolyticus]
MDVNQWLVAGIFILTIGALVLSNRRPAFIFAMSSLALIASGQLSLGQLTHGLSNKGLITLVLLLLISQAIDKTALIKSIGHKLINKSYAQSFWRLFAVTFTSSALLNNTAIVASLTGPVKQNQRHLPSRLLIPLSYAAILGGTVTLVGTSTNLIVDSFLIENGHPGFEFWDFTLFGLTAGLLCGGLMYVLSPMLPKLEQPKDDYKQYLIEAEVDADSPLVGQSIEDNHLRNLPELFLVEVVREGHLISPVHPDLVLEAHDKLIFTGNVKRMDTLSHIPGLSIFAQTNGLLKENLTEVVISNRSWLINKTLKQANFRAVFDAAVVAIRREGEAVSGKLGEIPLQAGDNLLLATGADFQGRDNLTRNFFFVSEHQIQQKLSKNKDRLTVGGFLAAIALGAIGLIPLTTGLLVLLALLTLVGVLSGNEIRRQLPVNLIMVIVGALGLATALEQSGLLSQVTSLLMPLVNGGSPFLALVMVYLVTLLLTEMVTNNAAAALMFPFAWNLIQTMDYPVMPFALAIAFAASASFISPYGYQTNLLVFSAGRYRYLDFVKYGLPISALYSTVLLGLLKYWFEL